MKRQRDIFAAASVFSLSLGAFANDFGNAPEVKAITQGQPRDVAALVERIVECSHWGGEDPYDKARAEAIAKAASSAGCDRIEPDTQVLRKKYKGNKAVADAIARAENLAL
ncbi:MAG: hypothetical protein NDJ89_16395 [Oligoflexia bacterium]|nr:hypothetical protein [Oligoflexia bacterium]